MMYPSLRAVMSDIPLSVHKVLEQVQFYDREAILVGGYLRDLHCARMPKDLDIVVQHSTDAENICEAMQGFDFDCDMIESNKQQEHSINFSFEAKFKIESCPLPINIIGACFGQTPMEKLLSHDFGLCRIWFDGKDVQCTEEYLADVNGGCFTLLRCRDRHEWDAVYSHYERLQKKYPWPMRISAEYLKMIRGGFYEEGGEEIIF